MEPRLVPEASDWRDDPSVRPDTIARLDKVLELLAVHGVVETACRQAHCSKATFYDFRERHPEFAAEAEDAAARAVPELEATGWACARKALSDPRYLPMLRFALAAKAGWKESTHLDISSQGKPAKDPRDMTDEELVALIEASRSLLEDKPKS